MKERCILAHRTGGCSLGQLLLCCGSVSGGGVKDTQIIASDLLLPFSCELTPGLVCAEVHMFMIKLPVSSAASSGLNLTLRPSRRYFISKLHKHTYLSCPSLREKHGFFLWHILRISKLKSTFPDNIYNTLLNAATIFSDGGKMSVNRWMLFWILIDEITVFVILQERNS